MMRFQLLGIAVFASFIGIGVAVAQNPAAQGGAISVSMTPRLHFTADEMAFADAISANPALASFYGENGLKPVFSTAGASAVRAVIRDMVTEIPAHGIPSARYRPETLLHDGNDITTELAYARALSRMIEDLTGGMIRPAAADPHIYREVKRPDTATVMRDFLQSPEPARFLAELAPQTPAYKALMAALGSYSKFRAPADLPKAPEAVWRVGMQGQGVLPLRQRLESIGFTSQSPAPDIYDDSLAQAVADFQQAVGLTADGIAGPGTIRRLNSDDGDSHMRAVQVALERLRWMGGEDLNTRYVWVNIPEYTARIMEGSHEVFSTRVVVGKTDPEMRTPEFSDQMEYVVVNPRWNVPRSITVKEYLPKLKADRNAVSHLDVVNGKGNVIPRDQIDFAAYDESNFPYRIRQKPSDDNALGLVKFIFPNPWNIYLHDTPTKHLFAENKRAYSHGCVRIGDPFDLAYQLLSPQSSDPQAVFQKALDSGRERYLALTPNVPVHLVYFTAYPDEAGKIRYFADVYGRDAAVWAQMEKAGLDLDV